MERVTSFFKTGRLGSLIAFTNGLKDPDIKSVADQLSKVAAKVANETFNKDDKFANIYDTQKIVDLLDSNQLLEKDNQAKELELKTLKDKLDVEKKSLEELES